MRGTSYVGAYQEWEILRERPRQQEERLEKAVPTSQSDESFGCKLQEARLKLRMPVSELSVLSSVPARSISAYENGGDVPSRAICALLENALAAASRAS